MDLLYRIFGDNHLQLQWAIAALSVFGLSLLLTPLMRAIALRGGLLAQVRARDVHVAPTPRLGGVAIYMAFAIGVLLFEPLAGHRPDSLSHIRIDYDRTLLQLRAVLLGATVAMGVGLLDDMLSRRNGRGLAPLPHFLGQVLAAAAALLAGLNAVHGISNPLASHLFYAHPEKHLQILFWPPLAVAFTLFWIVGMMNTVNFLDGLDGLAAGVVAIAAILLAIWSGRTHDVGVAPLPGSEVLVLPPLILAAALLGFLVYNWYPARIFMADAGAQFAGFTVGALAILGPAKIGTALLILAVPILDIAWVFIRRPVSGKAFFSADREHLHHRLLARGMSTPRIVLGFYAICIALGAVDLALSHVSKLIAFLLVAVATVALLVRVAANRPSGAAAPAPPLPER